MRDHNRLKLISLLIGLLILSACSPPSDRRRTRRNGSETFQFSDNNAGRTEVPGTPTPGGNGGSTATPAPGGGGSPNYSFPVGFENCQNQFAVNGVTTYRFGASSSNANIGLYNICKGSGLDRVLVQFESGLSGRVCFIPTTYSDVSGTNKVAPIADTPSCVPFPNPGSVVEVPLNRDRYGYQNAVLRGVIILKDETHSYSYPYSNFYNNVYAFYICMNTYATTGSDAYCDVFKEAGRYVNHIF